MKHAISCIFNIMALKHFVLVISCIIEAAISVPVHHPIFRNDYTFVSAENLFLKEHKKQETWSDAAAQCSAEGARIFFPTSQAQTQAALLLNDSSKTTVWLGVHDLFSDGEFTTLDGKSLSEVYSNWGPGEPNNYLNSEHCVTMNSEGLYNDVPCESKYRYICAKKLENVNYNSICDTTDFEYIFSFETNHCYKLHTIPKIWKDAFKICKAEQSQLAVINDQNEANLFVLIIAQHPIDNLNGNFNKINIHSGFNDFIIKGTFLTVDGKHLKDAGYDVWGPDQPDNHANVERCGAILRDGKLNDINCDTKAMFICEKTSTYQS